MPQIWLKRALVPLWLLENAFIVFMLVMACMQLRVAGSMGWFEYENGITRERINVTPDAIVTAFAFVSIGLNIFEVVQFFRCKLSPVQMLASAIANAILWAIVVVIGCTTAGIITYSLPIGAILVFVGKIIYALVMLRRQRKGLLPSDCEEYSMKTNSLVSSMIETPGKKSSLTLSDTQRSQRSDPFRSFGREI